MDIQSKSNNLNRNAAFSMNLVNPESDETDAIHCMVNLKGSLICFLEKSISKILPAEVVDPDNKEPDTRHSYQFIHSIGSRNPFVARTILQAKAILDSVVLRNGLNKQTILDHVWDCTQYLINCENSYYEVLTDTTKLMYKCDEIVNQGKAGSHVTSLPQVKNLDQRVVTFLANGKRFLEKSHELLCIFYGSAFSDSNFQAYREWMAKHKPTKTDIWAFLEQNKDWIKLLAMYRNALDVNHSKPGFKVVIENFKLRAGNKFTNPCWQYDFSAKNGDTQEEPSDLVRDMDVFLTNMLIFFESLFLFCIKDNWDTRFDFEIYRHEEESINAKCPALYFISLKQR